MKFVAILGTDDAKLFWRAMTSSQSSSSEGDAVLAIDHVLQRVDTLPDHRSRQLIRETLQWAKMNIGKFSFWVPTEQERHGHLPNIFTLGALFEGISRASRDWNSTIDKIVHDQQSQFEQTLQQWHSFLMTADPKPIFHFGNTPIQFPDISGSCFEIGNSRDSAGLQVVDIVLWVSRRITFGSPIDSKSTELSGFCVSPDDIFYMSFDWIETELYYAMALRNQPLSEAQLSEGRRRIGQFEQHRQHLMREDREGQVSDT